eukprot:CAMPEP_0196589054 /NCGR_PEP_ID=MMETSP1081-20130531/62541_1 /TAXON_ID=36882 /ORGANISM="Pyramimonas amylifera, Strain CCMP720" /LENGTH=503 /DNA_ID=CAMNT_0041911759 /DNA_START=280 /DNA_END=1791 /DNA_ORIENTATION=+
MHYDGNVCMNFPLRGCVLSNGLGSSVRRTRHSAFPKRFQCVGSSQVGDSRGVRAPRQFLQGFFACAALGTSLHFAQPSFAEVTGTALNDIQILNEYEGVDPEFAFQHLEVSKVVDGAEDLLVDFNAESRATSSSATFKTIAFRGCVAAIAACIAEAVTLPLDVVKVRTQLSRSSKPSKFDSGLPGFQGMMQRMQFIANSEGICSLWKGLKPGLQHYFLSGGVRIGLYDPCKLFLISLLGAGTPAFCVSGIAGLICGGAGTLVANPTDVVKVRMQGMEKQPDGEAPRGLMQEYLAIVKEDGVLGLWNGILPNITRSSLVSALELLGYDSIRMLILVQHPSMDLPIASLFAGLLAGGFCGLVINPVDIVKVNTMNQSSSKSEVVFGLQHKISISQAQVDRMTNQGNERLLYGDAYYAFGTTMANPRADYLALKQAHLELNQDVKNLNEALSQSSNASAMQVARSIIESEGPKGLLQGSIPSIARVGVFGGVMFFMQETILGLFLM